MAPVSLLFGGTPSKPMAGMPPLDAEKLGAQAPGQAQMPVDHLHVNARRALVQMPNTLLCRHPSAPVSYLTRRTLV